MMRRSRRDCVAFSDDTRECELVGLPVAKTTMKAKQRSLFTICDGRGEHLQPAVFWCPEKAEQSLAERQKKALREARPTFYDGTSTDALTASGCKNMQAGAREARERASACER